MESLQRFQRPREVRQRIFGISTERRFVLTRSQETNTPRDRHRRSAACIRRVRCLPPCLAREVGTSRRYDRRNRKTRRCRTRLPRAFSCDGVLAKSEDLLSRGRSRRLDRLPPSVREGGRRKKQMIECCGEEPRHERVDNLVVPVERCDWPIAVPVLPVKAERWRVEAELRSIVRNRIRSTTSSSAWPHLVAVPPARAQVSRGAGRFGSPFANRFDHGSTLAVETGSKDDGSAKMQPRKPRRCWTQRRIPIAIDRSRSRRVPDSTTAEGTNDFFVGDEISQFHGREGRSPREAVCDCLIVPGSRSSGDCVCPGPTIPAAGAGRDDRPRVTTRSPKWNSSNSPRLNVAVHVRGQKSRRSSEFHVGQRARAHLQKTVRSDTRTHFATSRTVSVMGTEFPFVRSFHFLQRRLITAREPESGGAK